MMTQWSRINDSPKTFSYSPILAESQAYRTKGRGNVKKKWDGEGKRGRRKLSSVPSMGINLFKYHVAHLLPRLREGGKSDQVEPFGQNVATSIQPQLGR